MIKKAHVDFIQGDKSDIDLDSLSTPEEFETREERNQRFLNNLHRYEDDDLDGYTLNKVYPAFIDEINSFYGWFINDIGRDDEWVKRYLKIKNNHTLLGVIVNDKWKIREIILRWRYFPKFKCVKNRLEKEYNNLYF